MKKLIYLFVAIIGLFAYTNVDAASGSITASTSSKTVVVGSTFTVTVKVSCSTTIGSWQFGISYDNANISLQSGDTSVVGYGDGKIKSQTYTYKFKAIKSGTASIRVVGANMADWDTVTLFTPSVSSTNVTVKTQAQIEASYSKDNTLKSLSVTGYKLSPEFNKNTTEYSVDVSDDTETVNVTASVNDSTAHVSGTGIIDVSEGKNKINIVVTAQNGSTKTYVINVTVKDLNPININIDGNNFSVVKKANLLTNPTGFTATTIKINDIEVPAFESELAKITLVGLKNEEGTIALYMFDESKKTYTVYNELRSSSITLYPLVSEEIPEGFDKSKIIINNLEYTAYKKGNTVIAYAMNIETGEKAFYRYDKTNNVFMKYDKDANDDLSEQVNEFKLYIFALSGVASLLLIISIITSRKNAKLKKILTKINSKEA